MNRIHLSRLETSARELVVARHAQSPISTMIKKGSYQGLRNDLRVGLDEIGRTQAGRLGKYLAERLVGQRAADGVGEVVLCLISDYKRVKGTLARVREYVAIPDERIVECEELRERDQGSMVLRSPEARQEPDYLEQMRLKGEDPIGWVPPGSPDHQSLAMKGQEVGVLLREFGVLPASELKSEVEPHGTVLALTSGGVLLGVRALFGMTNSDLQAGLDGLGKDSQWPGLEVENVQTDVWTPTTDGIYTLETVRPAADPVRSIAWGGQGRIT